MIKDLCNSGVYKEGYPTKECLKFCFLPITRGEPQLVVELWNTRGIQRQKRCKLEGGKPDIMFFTPKMYGTHSYLKVVDIDAKASKEMYTENCVDFHEDVKELVQLCCDYVAPSNECEAVKLFSKIAGVLKNY